MRNAIELNAGRKETISAIRILKPRFIFLRQFYFMFFLELRNLFTCRRFKKSHFSLFIKPVNDRFQFF